MVTLTGIFHWLQKILMLHSLKHMERQCLYFLPTLSILVFCQPPSKTFCPVLTLFLFGPPPFPTDPSHLTLLGQALVPHIFVQTQREVFLCPTCAVLTGLQEWKEDDGHSISSSVLW